MSGRERVIVFAPATVANLGPGYDVIGLALERPGDRVIARRSERPGVRLLGVSGAFALPPASESNTAAVAARLVLELLGAPFGVALELEKGLPLGSGLGSSGASAAAAATAVNLLAGAPLAPEELVAPCAEAEAAACGAAHPDNVAPALLGGITLLRQGEVIPIRTALELQLAVISPHQELPTRLARAAIPPQVPLGEATANAANLAAMVYGLAIGDAALVGRALVDHIAEPRRAPLIPGFAEARAAALESGAIGASISGAGPTLFALCRDRAGAERAGAAMSAALSRLGIEATLRVSAVAPRGAREVTE